MSRTIDWLRIPPLLRRVVEAFQAEVAHAEALWRNACAPARRTMVVGPILSRIG
jgi:hypothetical protein